MKISLPSGIRDVQESEQILISLITNTHTQKSYPKKICKLTFCAKARSFGLFKCEMILGILKMKSKTQKFIGEKID